ncbi:brain acid soluble protein 1-like [Pteropus medius]|uniref:brain acid soluble protein 1-like n=1 Tax=Pteropus vampyrus TaxID=132908 RepID=UPI00196B04D6|nr:brain acid soluble protein 1-like [Pteropus giganteus]
MKERGRHKSRGPKGSARCRSGSESATATPCTAAIQRLPGHQPPGASDTPQPSRAVWSASQTREDPGLSTESVTLQTEPRSSREPLAPSQGCDTGQDGQAAGASSPEARTRGRTELPQAVARGPHARPDGAPAGRGPRPARAAGRSSRRPWLPAIPDKAALCTAGACSCLARPDPPGPPYTPLYPFPGRGQQGAALGAQGKRDACGEWAQAADPSHVGLA